MKNLFKPLTKRDAVIASVIFGAAIIWLAISIIKDLSSGLVFDDIRSSFLMLFFCALIEYAMVTIARSRPDENDSAEAEKPQDDSAEAETPQDDSPQDN